MGGQGNRVGGREWGGQGYRVGVGGLQGGTPFSFLAVHQSGVKVRGGDYSQTNGEGGISEGWATVELMKLLKAAD